MPAAGISDLNYPVPPCLGILEMGRGLPDQKYRMAVGAPKVGQFEPAIVTHSIPIVDEVKEETGHGRSPICRVTSAN